MIKRFTLLLMLLGTCCLASAANYLTFTAETDGSSFSIKGDKPHDLQYSLDNGETWTPLADMIVVLQEKGDKALLRGNNPQGFSGVSSPSSFTKFSMTGSIAASGSVMSLVDNKGESVTIPNDFCFRELFSGCSSLTQAPELPATELTLKCYLGMFSGCSNLTQAPVLPATNLTEGCYMGMFGECSNLTQAPELPVTKLAPYCYAKMFKECSNLTQAPELPAMDLASNCYLEMFSYCTSLTQAPALPATQMADNCYYYMFSNCTNLTQAPTLPATELAERCYSEMFIDCFSLTQAPELPATKLAMNCYTRMFSGCSSLTQAPELLATEPTVIVSDDGEIVADDYLGMFYGCTNLSYIKVNFTQWSGIPDGDGECPTEIDKECVEIAKGWVYNVAPTGTFVCPKELSEEYGPHRIPQGWTMQTFEHAGTKSLASTDFSIWNEGRTLFVCGAKGLVEIYNLNGQLLRAAQGKNNETIRFIMPAEGTYIVKSGSMSQKTRVD